MKIKKFKRPKIRIRRPRVRIRWRKRTSKWVIGTVVFFFLTVFALQLVLLNYSKSILQNILNQQIESVTGGLYKSSFDDIEISYSERSLTIKNLFLIPQEVSSSTLKERDPLELEEIYYIFIPALKIADINLRKAYLQNFIDIGMLELLSPEIKLRLDLDDPEKSNTPFKSSDIYKFLPANIEEFLVRTVRINDGKLSIFARKNAEENYIKISPFHLELNSFHINEHTAGQTDKIFFTDDFFLEADSIRGQLSNKKYGLNGEALIISSRDSSAFARNIKVEPLLYYDEFKADTTLASIYNINFPQVYMYGLSLNDLYHNNDLIAGEVTVLSPSFQLINLKPLSPGEKENFRMENLYPVVDKVLTSIQVKNLYLRNGQVRIQEYKEHLQDKLSSDIQSARIHQFVLDSTSGSENQKLLFSDQIDFTLKNYSLKLSDNVHYLQAQELNFSSEQSNIKATDFRLFADTLSTHNLQTTGHKYYANAPSIELSGVDILQAYNYNILNIDSLKLDAPSFTLLRQRNSASLPSPVDGQKFHEEDLYALIEDYLYSLYIGEISLEKGDIQIRTRERQLEGVFVSNIRNASFWKFRLDSTSAYQMNKLFYANDFELEIENYDHELPDNLHRITADEIGISTLKDNIYISDLKIFAGSNQFPYADLHGSNVKNLLNLHIPLLVLDEVDILSAYLYKRLEVGNVLIPSPSIQMGILLGEKTDKNNLIKSSSIYDLMKDFLEIIQVKNLKLYNGNLDLAFYADKDPLIISGRKTDIQVNNFRFDSLTSLNPKRLFFADNVNVKVEDYATHLPDGVHIIRAEKFLASTERQEILAENVSINTAQSFYTEEELLGHYGQKGYFNMLLPKVHLTGIDFDRAYYDDYLKIDSIITVKPEVRYTYMVNNNRDKNRNSYKIHETNFYDAIAPYFGALQVERLIMENGSFKAVQQDNNSFLESTLLEGISLQMDSYLVDSVTSFDTQRFLFAEDIRIHIRNYQQELLDEVHTISARNLELSTASQYVNAEDIQLKPDSKNSLRLANLLSNTFKNRYSIRLPQLQLKGIGFDEVYRNGRLEIDELLLQKPDISIRNNVRASDGGKGDNGSKVKNLDLYALIRGNLKSLEIKTTRILSGQGQYTQISGLSAPFELEADYFDAHIYNFKINEKEENKGKILYSDDVKVFLAGFERNLPDSLHTLKVEELTISTLQNELEVIGAEIYPRVDVDIIQRLEVSGKNKLFHLTIPHSVVDGVDISLLEKDSLQIEKISVNNFELELFRFPHLEGTKATAAESKEGDVWSALLLKRLKYLASNSLNLDKAKLIFTSVGENNDSSSFELNNIGGLVHGFRIDAEELNNSERILFSDRVQLWVRDYVTTLDNDLYRLKIDNARIDTGNRNLKIDSISVVPTTDRRSFARSKSVETDQFTFKNKDLTLTNVDYDALLRGEIRADSLLMNGFALLVYRDKRQPFPQNHFPKMPQEAVRNLGFYLMINGLALRNGYIAYEEQAKGARGTGFIDLQDLEIISSQLTNDSILLAGGLVTNMQMATKLMGSGKLEATFEIPMGDTLNRHTFYGKLDEMDLAAFNPILEKTIFVKIKEGHTEEIKFFVEANAERATGIMEFRYSGLQLALVNKKSGKTGGPIRTVGSFLANWLVVNTNNNDEEDKPFIKGEMVYERDESRSTVNYWVKTLVNGFKSSIGL